MAPAPSGNSGLRFLSPSALGFTLLLFFVPWIEISCVNKAGERETFLRQSGLQIATGKTSTAGTLAKLEQEMEAQGEEIDIRQQFAGVQSIQDPAPLPLLWLYVGVLASTVILALVLPLGTARTFTLAGGALGAVVVLGFLIARGFPVQERVKEANEEKDAQMAERLQAIPNPEAIMQMGGAQNDLRFDTRFSMFFYLNCLALVGGFVLIFWENSLARKNTKRRALEEQNDVNPFDDWDRR